MTRLQAGVLWCASLAVFVLLNPIAGLDQRDWQEMTLIYGGHAAAVLALSGALPPAALGIWVVILAAWHRGPWSVNTVMLVFAGLGVYALAQRTAHVTRIVQTIVGLNVAAIALQAAGVWESALRLVFPRATYTVFIEGRPWAGLTAGTGDVGIVLAMGLPFLTRGRALWLLPAAVLALLSTEALSAILAGMAGLTVAFWPKIRAQFDRDWRTAWGVLAGFGLSSFLGREEILAAWSDDRWKVWWAGGKRWLTEAPVFGFGLGAWNAQNLTVRDGHKLHIWDQAHFDALQLGYEAGLVGLALGIWVFAWAWQRARGTGNSVALGAMAALAVAQFGHFPLHLAAGGVMVALVAGEATRG